MKTLILIALFAPVFALGAASAAKKDDCPKKFDAKKHKKLVEQGRKLFTERTCTACHGPKGMAETDAAKSLGSRNFHKDCFRQGASIQEIFATITDGVKDNPNMISFKTLPEAERCALAVFVRSLNPKALHCREERKK